jgi:transcriptional regulator with XRE-family HTH domain
MGKVFDFAVNKSIFETLSEVKRIRKEYNLTVLEMAGALDTYPSNIELWESKPGMGPNSEQIVAMVQYYINVHAHEKETNFLFDTYPLRVARDMLGLSVAQISTEYGINEAVWRKYENNSRLLDRKVLRNIESKISEHFTNTCKKAL